MQFNNPAIEIPALPRAEDIDLVPVERNYWKVLQLRWLFTASGLLAAGALGIGFVHKFQKPVVIGVAAGAWILTILLNYVFMRQSFRRTAYAMREKDVLFRTGWIIRRTQVCPFNRIQHCSVHAGPLERRYGLSSISLFTAGSNGSDIRIPGVTEATAASMREFIMQKVRSDEQPAN